VSTAIPAEPLRALAVTDADVAHRSAVFAATARTLDGSENNPRHSDWGRAGTQYLRVAAAHYGDGRGAMVAGPPARYVSNRVFNDIGQNLFSEGGVTQWAWAWGQFIDHDFGLREESSAEAAPIAFQADDPLERFRNDLGHIAFDRTPAASGSALGVREQINTLSSYIDASNVYGVSAGRLEWLREGPVDGVLSDNAAGLLLPQGYLPQRDARGDVAAAPPMEILGRLRATPGRAKVAGDVRANENLALTALHTLFAREHNRIVAMLGCGFPRTGRTDDGGDEEDGPGCLPHEVRFQIARRVVGAEIQYITYHEFLPALGVRLEPYRGYDPTRNAGLANEFAVVGYRAHSMIHGEFEPTAPEDRYSAEQLATFRSLGVEIEQEGGHIELVIPLNVAFGNPDLLQAIGLEVFVTGLSERQYKNDEQIDDVLRSVLFQVPKPGIPDPSVCGLPFVDPRCFSGVTDLGAIDIQRGRDHGIPTYNDLRRAYGLAPKGSFAEITGETTESFPPGLGIDDPAILEFVELRDAAGDLIPPGSPEAEGEAVFGVRRSTVAARLQAIYEDVERLDAFVGMIAEPHLEGAEFGELQLAIWRSQFSALRDGDRYYYENDPVLRVIAKLYGVDYRHTLAEVIQLNTGTQLPTNVFRP
jgi:hypothetical protein